MDTLSSENSNSYNQKQYLALRVAYYTIKDGCILHQKRLLEVEEENQQLRERLAQNTESTSTASQVSELQRQNAQLNSHINMISTENHELRKRLSQIAKDQSRSAMGATLTNTNAVDCNEVLSPQRATSSRNANQNLKCSKTFTQNSTNPNLRKKLLSSDNCGSTEILDVSLEPDVTFEVFADKSVRLHPGATVASVAIPLIAFILDIYVLIYLS